MKYPLIKTGFFCALAACYLAACCKEKPLEIPQSTIGKRKILVEELTGTDCPNCPSGTAELVGLASQYGKNLVVVSIHAGDRGGFNKQLPGAQFNFNTDEAEAVVQYVGVPPAYPSASVNRQSFGGNVDLFETRPWKDYIEQEAKQDFGLLVRVENKFDAATRELIAEVIIAPEKTLTGDHKLTAYIVQDSIVDPQNAFGTVNPNYIHRHILRKVLTNASGDAINEALTAGATITRTFSFVLPADFDVHHCSVVAFVHHSGQPDKEVLQVGEKYVIE